MGSLSIRNTPTLLFPVALTRGDTLSDSEHETKGNFKPGIRIRLSLGMTQIEKPFESQYLHLSHSPVFSSSYKSTLNRPLSRPFDSQPFPWANFHLNHPIGTIRSLSDIGFKERPLIQVGLGRLEGLGESLGLTVSLCCKAIAAPGTHGLPDGPINMIALTFSLPPFMLKLFWFTRNFRGVKTHETWWEFWPSVATNALKMHLHELYF